MRRKYSRRDVTGFYGDVALENSIVNSVVKDISARGFKLSQVPESFQNDKHVYTIIISKEGAHYKLLAKPCWEKREIGRNSRDVGFKVIDAPWEWTELTLEDEVVV